MPAILLSMSSTTNAAIRNTFTRGPEGWCSYDYHASMIDGGVNVFVLSVWRPTGGPGDAGHVWADHTRWSADTPEKPLSILPLIFYRNWVDLDPADLRNAEVSVYLRGENLKLDGGHCLFWVHSAGGRWHLNSQPLQIADGKWAAEPSTFTLHNDESKWHHSWPRDPKTSGSLDEVLGNAHSYGFSFINFSAEVTGRLCMSQFEIRTPKK